MAHDAEIIERAALIDLFDSLTPELAAQLGVTRHEIADAWVGVASALPSTAVVINRAIGLGLRQPAIEQTVKSIIAAYEGAGCERYFVHVHPDVDSARLNGWFEKAGLEWARGWVKFERGRDPVPEASTALELRPAVAADGPAIGRIIADAFDLGDAAAPWIALMIGRPGWHVYVSVEGGVIAGTGSMLIRDRQAWLDWGATAPDFRRRGSQSGLMARRLQDALDLGCETMFTTTGEEIAGDPQHAYKNIIKSGFRPLYTRLNYAPAK